MKQIFITLYTTLGFFSLLAMEARKEKYEVTQIIAHDLKKISDRKMQTIIRDITRGNALDSALTFVLTAMPDLNVNYKDASGHTALYYAEQRMRTQGDTRKLIEALRSRGAISV